MYLLIRMYSLMPKVVGLKKLFLLVFTNIIERAIGQEIVRVEVSGDILCLHIETP